MFGRKLKPFEFDPRKVEDEINWVNDEVLDQINITIHLWQPYNSLLQFQIQKTFFLFKKCRRKTFRKNITRTPIFGSRKWFGSPFGALLLLKSRLFRFLGFLVLSLWPQIGTIIAADLKTCFQPEINFKAFYCVRILAGLSELTLALQDVHLFCTEFQPFCREIYIPAVHFRYIKSALFHLTERNFCLFLKEAQRIYYRLVYVLFQPIEVPWLGDSIDHKSTTEALSTGWRELVAFFHLA